MQHEIAQKIKDIETGKEEADRRAREIVSLAIQRCAGIMLQKPQYRGCSPNDERSTHNRP